MLSDFEANRCKSALRKLLSSDTSLATTVHQARLAVDAIATANANGEAKTIGVSVVDLGVAFKKLVLKNYSSKREPIYTDRES